MRGDVRKGQRSDCMSREAAPVRKAGAEQAEQTERDRPRQAPPTPSCLCLFASFSVFSPEPSAPAGLESSTAVETKRIFSTKKEPQTDFLELSSSSYSSSVRAGQSPSTAAGPGGTGPGSLLHPAPYKPASTFRPGLFCPSLAPGGWRCRSEARRSRQTQQCVIHPRPRLQSI